MSVTDWSYWLGDKYSEQQFDYQHDRKYCCVSSVVILLIINVCDNIGLTYVARSSN